MVFRSLSLHEKVVPVQILHLPVHPPSIPLFPSPIIPLIVMVMGSIVRDQNGQLNWWKRDHQEGKEEGVCIYQTWRIFIHWRLKEYIMALEGHLKKTVRGFAVLVLDCLAWLDIYEHQRTAACSIKNLHTRTCTSVVLFQCGVKRGLSFIFVAPASLRHVFPYNEPYYKRWFNCCVSFKSLTWSNNIFLYESFINL